MIQANTHTFQEVADAIAHHIVVTRTIGDAAYINLPLRYPGGSSVVVRITTAPSYAGEPNRFLVSDHALGYDEATMMGVGRIYVRQAGEIADRVGINFDDHAFVIEGASRDQLAGAVVAVANCSFEAVALVAQRVEDGGRMTTDLIARLKAAPEGSRELDVAVIREVFGYGKEALLWHGLRYTTSLDHALTLVPEGWSIAELWESVEPSDRPWWGVSLRRDEPYRVDKALGIKTPALALVIACMKARTGKADG